MANLSITIDEDELASIIISVLEKHYNVKSIRSAKRVKDAQNWHPEDWVPTKVMALKLEIGERTLFKFMNSDDSPWQEGRHYKRRTPALTSPWVWHKNLTIEAWQNSN